MDKLSKVGLPVIGAIFLAFIDLLKKQLLLFNVLALPTILDNTLPKIISTIQEYFFMHTI